ncbi:MAG: hypothetical protein LBC55_00215, partial [Desulfovibrio sp.]|nr:hypothetical protein [Desulfovibrio sp.]
MTHAPTASAPAPETRFPNTNAPAPETGGPARETHSPEAVNSLGLVFFPAFDWAISPTHPEREERLLYTRDQLREEGLFDVPGIL